MSVDAVVGDHNREISESTEQYREVVNVKIHPAYQVQSSFDMDFALVQLSFPLELFSWESQPICLPDNCEDSCQSGDMVMMVGWGRKDPSGDPSQILQKAIVPVHSSYDCAMQLSSTTAITTNMVCTGYQHSDQFHSCSGDSGGAIFTFKKGYFEASSTVKLSFEK